ncbi:MAG: hypothetical protein O3C40_07150 [Planctomycetota bacterium]|nr:hypothetical protein [Planctomycetota bacterium]
MSGVSRDTDSEQAVAARRPRRKWRFSLRKLFAVCIIATIVASHLITSVRLYFANSELRELRREVGYLDVRNTNLPYIVAVKTLDDLTWKWKLYLPAGRKFIIREFLGDAPPKSNFNVQGSHVQRFGAIFTGYVDLELTLRRDHEGKWVRKYVVTDEDGSSIDSPTQLPAELVSRMEDSAYSRSYATFGVGHTIQLKLKDSGTSVEPLDLVRLHIKDKLKGTPYRDEPTFGVFVRLEEETE